jgi:DMSO/TMAO reductase YedYZ molybdopterin-dependent catalytic subunit
MTPSPKRRALGVIDQVMHTLESRGEIDRRRFLNVSGSAFAAALLGGCGLAGSDKAERVLSYAERKNEAVERWLFRHTSMNQGSPGAAIAGKDFPTYFISETVPMWDSGQGEWSLAVGGLVKSPATLNLQALMALTRTEQRVDHFCVEGWNAVARFTGARVSELARLVGAAPEARYVDFAGFDDGYHESWDIESAMHPQTMIVYAKDGSALTAAYGAPARVHSPVKLGYKNTKYLTKVTFMAERNGGYWTDQGYEWYGGT